LSVDPRDEVWGSVPQANLIGKVVSIER